MASNAAVNPFAKYAQGAEATPSGADGTDGTNPFAKFAPANEDAAREPAVPSVPMAGLSADEQRSYESRPRTQAPSWWDELRASPVGGALQTVLRSGQGIEQLGLHTAADLADLGGHAPNPVADAIRGASEHTDESIRAQNEDYEAAKQRVIAGSSHPRVMQAMINTGENMGSMINPAGMAGSAIGDAGTIGNAALRGAVSGGAYGASMPVMSDDEENFWVDKAFQMLKGAGIGGVAGAASGALTREPHEPTDVAKRYVANLVEKSGKTPDDLEAAQQAAGDKPITAAEAIGPQGEINLMAAARRKGETGEAVGAAMTERAKNRPDRVMDDMAASSGIDPKAARGVMDDVIAAGRAKATPLYKQAFSGGSTAPLQDQLERSFDQASRDHAAAMQAVSDAENAMTMAKAPHLPSDNVYAASSANQSEREAAAQLDTAMAAEEQARQTKEAIRNMLQRSQSDEAEGVNGGVWSPRLQQFLDSPEVKAGISRGLTIQRREALASGEPFNPNEYALKGFDENGDPIVGNVPNLRLLDAGKRGLDAMLEDYRDKTTGKMQWNEESRSLEAVRKAYVDEIDHVAPPEYGQARSAASDYLSANHAFQLGQKSILNNRVTEAQFRGMVKNMSTSDIEAMKGGIANKIFDLAQTGTIRPKAFMTPLAQAKLEIALGPTQARNFVDNLESEAAMKAFEQRAQAVAGSQTTPLAQASRDMDEFENPARPTLSHAAEFIRHPVRGTLAGVLNLGQRAINASRTRGLGVEGRNEVGRLLMLPPKELADVLRNAAAPPAARPAPNVPVWNAPAALAINAATKP